MYDKSTSSLGLCENFSFPKTNHYCPVFVKIKYFKNISKGERGERTYACMAHVSRSWTIQIILQMFSLSFFTLLPDLYEILDSVRSDPYIQFYFFGPNKKMRVKMPNLRRNITISNGEVFFSTPFTRRLEHILF